MTVQTYYISDGHDDKECGGCGSVVRDADRHNEWHDRMEADRIGR